jgi:hypothetical protein
MHLSFNLLNNQILINNKKHKYLKREIHVSHVYIEFYVYIIINYNNKLIK